MRKYAIAYGGSFPDSFEALLFSGHLDSGGVLHCPSSSESELDDSTRAAIAANKATALEHLSYVYAAQGLSVQCPAEAVLAYDRPESHGGHGINVLYADGQVDFTPKAQAEKLIAELQSGHNPPRAEILKQ
jgi:prepilin-type processing-associated H-X9-DG protein